MKKETERNAPALSSVMIQLLACRD